MVAANYNIKIELGATFKRVLTFRDATSNTLLDFTGCSARMQIRKKAGAADPALLTLTSSSGGLTFPSAGKIQILITDEQTDALALTEGAYDLMVTDSVGEKVRYIEGTATGVKTVTKTTG